MNDTTPSQQASSDDPCRATATFSPARFLFFTLVFLTMTVGSIALSSILEPEQFGIQISAITAYTSAIVLHTFSANRGSPRYLFGCPIVQNQLNRIVLRHLMFTAILFVLLTAALQLRPYMSHWWLVASGAPKSLPPLTTALFVAPPAWPLPKSHQSISSRPCTCGVHYLRFFEQ